MKGLDVVAITIGIDSFVILSIKNVIVVILVHILIPIHNIFLLLLLLLFLLLLEIIEIHGKRLMICGSRKTAERRFAELCG